MKPEFGKLLFSPAPRVRGSWIKNAFASKYSDYQFENKFKLSFN